MSINYSLSQLGNIITTDANGAITSLNTSTYSSNLGPVGNVTITGGANGQVLSTNGSGALSWTSPAIYDPWTTTPTIIGAVTTDPIKPTMSKDSLRYRKVGDKIYHLQMTYQVAATNGTAGNGMYLYTLPGGLQFDTGIQIVNTNGNVTTIIGISYAAKIAGSNGSMYQAGSWATLMAYAYDSTRFYLATTGGIGGAAFGGIQNNTYFQIGAGTGDLNVNMEFTFTATT
jgi:hypothetical protein